MSGIGLASAGSYDPVSPPPPPPPSFTVSVSGSAISASSLAGASGTLSLSATPAGGSAPYSYAWTKTGNPKVSLGAASGQSPGAAWSGMSVGENASGFIAVTATDAGGLVATSSPAYDLTRTS